MYGIRYKHKDSWMWDKILIIEKEGRSLINIIIYYIR